MPTEIERRVAAIVNELGTRGACNICHGNPVQIQCYDPDTDEVTYSRYPDDRCLDCGRPINPNVIRRYGLAEHELP